MRAGGRGSQRHDRSRAPARRTADSSGRDTRIKEEEMRVVFVHGACVRDGSWWWHLAAAALQERGISSVAPALPSCGEGGRPAGPQGPGLPEDVAAVRAALTEGGEPIVVVAHSYGGIVAAEAAAGVATVRHLEIGRASCRERV